MVQTEEVELLGVQTAQSLGGFLITLQQQGFTQVLQHQVTSWFYLWRYHLTKWTLAFFFQSPPPLQTVHTETVATRQENRVSKDVTADGTAEMVLNPWSHFDSEWNWKHSRWKVLLIPAPSPAPTDIAEIHFHFESWFQLHSHSVCGVSEGGSNTVVKFTSLSCSCKSSDVFETRRQPVSWFLSDGRWNFVSPPPWNVASHETEWKKRAGL